MSNQRESLEGFLRKRHSVSNLFDGQMIAQLRETFGSAAAKLECKIIEMDGERDHGHCCKDYEEASFCFIK